MARRDKWREMMHELNPAGVERLLFSGVPTLPQETIPVKSPVGYLNTVGL